MSISRLSALWSSPAIVHPSQSACTARYSYPVVRECRTHKYMCSIVTRSHDVVAWRPASAVADDRKFWKFELLRSRQSCFHPNGGSRVTTTARHAEGMHLPSPAGTDRRALCGKARACRVSGFDTMETKTGPCTVVFSTSCPRFRFQVSRVIGASSAGAPPVSQES